MKRHLVGVVLMITVVAAHSAPPPNWVYYSASMRALMYYDPSTLTSDNGLMKVWNLVDLVNPPQQIANMSVGSIASLTVYNCRNFTSSTGQVIFYSGPSATGSVVMSNADVGPFVEQPPGSLGRDFQKDLCSGKLRVSQ